MDTHASLLFLWSDSLSMLHRPYRLVCQIVHETWAGKRQVPENQMGCVGTEIAMLGNSETR